MCIEDLSEEDQKIKDELDMLVERLQVGHCHNTTLVLVDSDQATGVGHIALQTCSRSHQDIDQDLYIFYDGGSEATQIP